MDTYKIVFEHWRVPNMWDVGIRKGKPDPDLLKRYRRGDWQWGPNGTGGKTICHILKDDTVIAQGEALCSMSDNFCYETGRNLAAWRAFCNSPSEQWKELCKFLWFDYIREIAEQNQEKTRWWCFDIP